MENNLPHIMSRVLNQPLMMDPAYARTFFAALSARIGVTRLADLSGEIEGREKLRVKADSYENTRDRYRPYRVQDGIAVIPVQGTLVNKYGHVEPYSGMTGYDGILARAADAHNDSDIRGVLLDNDTPGGDVAGCFDCVRSLREMSLASGKPMWASAYDQNCSAGMALASAADRRLITSTGYAGSVGVIIAHANYEKQMEQAGIDVTLIYAGANKVDGNPYAALPDDVYQRFLGETQSLRQEFAELVAEFTGTKLETILATEALSYRGQAAVDAGLADEVVNGNNAVQIFSDYLSTQGSTISLGARMSDQDKSNAAAQAADTDHQSKDQLDQSQIEANAKQNERQRISAILALEEAEGRSSLANHFAMNTDMTVEQAKAALAASPAESKASATLETLMQDEKDPAIGSDDDGSEPSESDKEFDAAMAAFKKTSA